MNHNDRQKIAEALALIAAELDISVSVNMEAKEGEYLFKPTRAAHYVLNCVAKCKPHLKSDGFREYENPIINKCSRMQNCIAYQNPDCVIHKCKNIKIIEVNGPCQF